MEAYAINDWDELEALYFGNSAEEEWTTDSALVRNQISSAPSKTEVEAKRRERNLKQQRQKMQIINQYKSHERFVSRKRFREAVLAVIGISMIAAMFSFILYRQSQITLQNYQNNETVSRISKLREETSQIKENLTVSVDLNQIRWEAMERLGMQDPSVRQVIAVEMPKTDLLVTNDFESSPVNSKIGLAAAKDNLAQYYLELE